MSFLKCTYTLTNTGLSNAVAVRGDFSVSMTFTGTGTLQLERSLDGGSTWGSVASKTADFESADNEGARSLYRFNCSTHAGSGNIVGILSGEELDGRVTQSDP